MKFILSFQFYIYDSNFEFKTMPIEVVCTQSNGIDLLVEILDLGKVKTDLEKSEFNLFINFAYSK